MTEDVRTLGSRGWALAGGLAVVLFVECVAELGLLGSGSAAGTIEAVTYLTLMWGAAGIAAAGAWRRRDRGWALVALGLVSTALADTYFQFWVDPVAGPYPSIADVLYLLQYPLIIAGLFVLSRRGRSLAAPFYALLTPVLGLAALWWWIAFDPVLGSLEGETAARLTTIAYPALDLLLLCSVLVALAGLGRRAGTALGLLALGATIVGVADVVYAVRVAEGSFPELTPVNALWPIGSLLMAAAAWVPLRGSGEAGPSEGRLELVFSLAAIAIAVLLSTWDHFERSNTVAVLLATLTLIAAAARLILLYFESHRARREALEAHRAQGRIETLHIASVEAALDCIISVDEAGLIVDWNPAATKTFGYTREQAIGRDVAELIVPPDLRDIYGRTFERLVSGHGERLIGTRIESIAMRADGSEIPVEISPTRADTDPPTLTSFIRDISKEKHQELERDRLAAMVRSADDAMLSATLDGTILAWNPAAERIYGYSAEEIVGRSLELLVPRNRLQELAQMREVVRRGESTAIETERRRKDGELIEVSLHVFPVYDDQGRLTGYSAVSRDITERRRREREAQRNRERRAWQHEIEEALEHDRLEFHRQPILDLRSGRISHHELLMRLRTRGELIPPGRFLPHAEDSPLMRRIDRWAIRHGIELAAERPVAINLSARSLSDPGIVAAVEAALRESGASAEDVGFEITETAAAEDLDSARSLVAALRNLGCSVALDDFGTGYGSFTYLARMAVNSLKIDMSFIQGLEESEENQMVVRSIVAVAHNFGLVTIAEGIEDRASLDLVRRFEVDEAQGYLIGRPGPDWTSEADVGAALRPADGP